MSTMRWSLPHNILSSSIEIMRPHGKVGNEGLALWFGSTEASGKISVTHAIDLRGTGFVTSPLFLSLSIRAAVRLTELADQLGAHLVGQVHSHPGRFIDLSEVDIAHGFRVPNFLSVVCPHYAQDPETRLSDCGMHVFERGAYRRLSATETSYRISTAPNNVSIIECEVSHD